ncbi:MAG: MauE/DoxX family redox-associated membrane protein [Gemmatimonadaceae bacterium]
MQIAPSRLERYGTVYLRLALAAGFLTAVADRFGLWGPPGATNVAWGDFGHFLAYTATLNPYLPAAWIPPLGWVVTVAEVGLGGALLIGVRTREAAFAAGVLLLLFALGMTVGTGVKSALNASVFSASGGAFLLAHARQYAWSVDALRRADRDTAFARARPRSSP